ncbi:MAG: hypothetical protein IH999_06310 [Proteobacteria bacterium]|nr:hypothetical protein [Pseudomonadota bacterium]
MPSIIPFLIVVFVAVSTAQAGERARSATYDPSPSAVAAGVSADRHLDDLLRAIGFGGETTLARCTQLPIRYFAASFLEAL